MTVDSTFTPPPGVAPTEEKAESAAHEGITQYTDGYAYEVPRPFLTLQQAASILGKSMRAIERSLLGKWGNKLPDGWVGRKMRTENGDEWRILPPPGFRVKLSGNNGGTSSNHGGTEYDTETVAESFEMTPTTTPEYAPVRKRPQWKPERHMIDQPAIVIDRSEEVEHLLRELVASQRALSEERRVHMEDLRMIHQLQSSMRLLEADSMERSKLRQELETAKTELSNWKEKYQKEINTPWWRKLFKSQP